MAVDKDIIEKSGTWFSYGDVRLGQGRDNVRAFLEENREILEEVRQKVLEAEGLLPQGGKDGD